MSRINALSKDLISILRYTGYFFRSIGRKIAHKTGVKPFKTLEEVVLQAQKDFSTKKVNLVGHSLGGMHALVYALENPEIIKNCYTLATPINGTMSAYLLRGSKTVGAQLRPNSDFIKAVQQYCAEFAPYVDTIFENFFSLDDPLVHNPEKGLTDIVPKAHNITDYLFHDESHGKLIYHKNIKSKIINLVSNSKEPVVFLHGFIMHKKYFEDYLKLLEKEHPESFTPENKNKIYNFSYDYLPEIPAKKIIRWYSDKQIEADILQELLDK